MSHQSGITANDLLREKFVQMKDGQIRVVVIVIENETLVIKEECNAEGTFNEDFEKMIPPLVEENRAAYYFIRLDVTSTISGYNWLLIVYVPENAKVRERMLYASTVSTLKREFGLMYITEEIRATSTNEITIDSYNEHIRSQSAPPPKTMREEEKDEIQRLEMKTDIGVTSRHQTLHGLKFPFDENVIDALNSFKNQTVDYVQLEIDHKKELILLSHSEANTTPEGIQKRLPENAGRYHIYRFKHDFNNETLDSLCFLYSIPGYGVKIQQRMVYASCRESVVDAIEKQFSITFDRKLELSDITDLTTAYLLQQFHPETAAAASAAPTTFAKPKASSTRGPRRLVKGTDNSEE